jgi:hypothetical protein
VLKFRATSISIGALLGFSSLFLPTSVLYAQPQQSSEAAAVTTPHITEPAQAGVPRLIQFNGTLKDSASRPVSGVASVTFAIYNEQDNGTALWSETQNVLADASGHYTVLLGSATANGVPAELFGTGESRWLGITIARQPETPRVLMASVPYALKAGDSDTLGGLPASSYVTTQQLAARPAVSSVAGPSTILATTNAAPSVIDAAVTGSGTTNFLPIWTSGSNLGNSLLFQTGGKMGLGTTTPAATLDINGGEILRGGYYEFPEDTATASNGGKQSHSFQWLSSVFNSSSGTAVNPAFGFRAIPLGNNTSNPSARLDLFYGLGGPTGTINDINVSFAANGNVGIGTTSPNFPLEIASNTEGQYSNPTVNLTISNYANTLDNDGAVALAFNPYIASKTNPEAQIEVVDDGEAGSYTYFETRQPGKTTNPFIDWLYADDQGNVTFSGDVYVSGTLGKATGTFKIDDPIDPANKYLSHSFVESPDMLDMYNGTVTLDSKGEALVTMPAWFDALNKSFQYQLTAVGAPGPGLYIKEKVHDNCFKIAGGTAGLEVSWQVTGVRHDAYANAHPTPVEEDKKADEVGHYLHPELFGAGPEKRIAANHKQSNSHKSVDPVLIAPAADPGEASGAANGYKR